MIKNLPLIVTAILVLSVAAIASVSALGEDTPTSTPTESPSPTNTPGETEAPEETASPSATAVPSPTTDPEADDAEDEGNEAEGEGEAGSGKQAAAIAAFCGKSVEEIETLHAEGAGWGALFKVCKLSVATGESVEDILADANENGFAFGNRFKALTDEERARSEGLPKNLGKAMKGQHDAEAEAEVDDAAEPEQGDSQGGKPKTSRGNGGRD